jgi:hypothetical protein
MQSEAKGMEAFRMMTSSGGNEATDVDKKQHTPGRVFNAVAAGESFNL